ncbi:MAG: FtsX-like permease family protein [Bacillota bacterium]|jgi:putative ABC transport system permease protein
MTLYRLARSNIRGLRHKYVSYLLSSAFSVLVFFLFASFVQHPDVAGGQILWASQVRMGMVTCQCIIVVFSFFFILYSSSAFVRSRKREFGLITLLGATKRQINRMLAVETGVIGSTALMAGMGLGFLLFKLMLMAMSWILQVKTPIRFAIVPGAAFLTVGVYGILFAVIALMTMRTIKSSEVIQLIRASQKPKAPPRFSKILVCLSAICLGAGYYLAWTANGHTLVLLMLPVVAIVSLGTYLFFTQSSVAAFRWLQRRKGIYYRDLNLLTISDMVFKMKENAQVLSAVAILMAVVLTSTSTIYTFRDLMMKDVESVRPYALAFAVNNEESSERLSSLARAEFASDGHKVTYEVAVAGLLADTEEWGNIVLLSESEYGDWATANGFEPVDVPPGCGARMALEAEDREAETVSVKVGRTSSELLIDRTVRWVGGFWPMEFSFFAVVDDGEYAEMRSAAPLDAHVAALGYQVEDWTHSQPAIERVRQQIPADRLLGFLSRAERYAEARQIGALTAFIAMFITTLFSIASGSMLYSRLFTELQEDQAKYLALRRLGLSRREMSEVLTRQIAILFFVPFTVGTVHCLMAFKALSNVLDEHIWQFAGLAVGIFFTLQVGYFLITRSAYVREATPAR